MGILNSEVDYNTLITNLGSTCLTVDACGTCKGEKCLVGYGKKCVTNCLKDKVTYVMNGQDNLPSIDGKMYDHEYLTDGITDLLKQCKNCDKDHFDNCLINVLRNCYEILLFGEIQNYPGSTLIYLNNIKEVNAEVANAIFRKM